MLLLILYSGLHFKKTSIVNEVTWLDDRDGIRFDRNSIVYAKGVSLPARQSAAQTDTLTIELAFKPLAENNDGHFRFLLLLHGGDDAEQLILGQWRSWLVIMNGDDYDAKRRRARISVDTLVPPQERFVTITSGDNGTAVFIDGQRVKYNRDLHLKLPDAGKAMQLVLGNSIYGRHPWAGEIYGLAYYDHVRSATAIRQHFQSWAREHSFAFARPLGPAGLYVFDEGQGRRVVDHAKGKQDLAIPAQMTILTKEFLAPAFGNTEYNLSLFQDMVINFTGFIPMGFLLSALFWHMRGHAFTRRLLIAMLACGAISLTIEVAQAWIPSRSSQMLDLILNTLGAGAGVILHSAYRRYFGARPPGAQAPGP
jgi:VanZ family protein